MEYVASQIERFAPAILVLFVYIARASISLNAVSRCDPLAADRLMLAKQIDAKGHVMNGEKEPGARVLLAISQEFGKSVDWLRTGAFGENRF